MHIIGAIFVIVLLLLFFRRGSEFTITIKNGEIAKVEGNINRSVVTDFSDAIRGVTSGQILGSRQGKGVQLRFRGDIGELTQQRLRNIYGVHNR